MKWSSKESSFLLGVCLTFGGAVVFVAWLSASPMVFGVNVNSLIVWFLGPLLLTIVLVSMGCSVLLMSFLMPRIPKRVCVGCGFVIDPDGRFCKHCGQVIGSRSVVYVPVPASLPPVWLGGPPTQPWTRAAAKPKLVGRSGTVRGSKPDLSKTSQPSRVTPKLPGKVAGLVPPRQKEREITRPMSPSVRSGERIQRP
jgi:hypothetical protein